MANFLREGWAGKDCERGKNKNKRPMNHPLCLHSEITRNSLDTPWIAVQHALQEIQKAILFVRTDRNNLLFPASIGPRFIGSLNLSIYRLRKIWVWSCRDGPRDIGKHRCRRSSRRSGSGP